MHNAEYWKFFDNNEFHKNIIKNNKSMELNPVMEETASPGAT